jgi:26S proteasome regulatory subunit N9
MNPLRLVELAVIASKEIDSQCTISSPASCRWQTGPRTDPERLITFLTSLSTRLPESTSPAAHVLHIASRARARLLFGDTDGTRTDLDDAQRTLDGLGTVEPRVNAAYYGVRADLHKARAEYGPYYRHALLYLACVTLADLPADERRVRAHDLALAALLGDSIYNFGELLVHPILGELAAAPEHVWLRDLLLAFNEGSIGKFEALAPRFPAEVRAPGPT